MGTNRTLRAGEDAVRKAVTFRLARAVALSAALGALCLHQGWARGQRGGGVRRAEPHYNFRRMQPMRRQEFRPGNSFQPQQRTRPQNPANQYPGNTGQRPAYNSPPGHLGSWLNEHRNLNVGQQEHLLRNDPTFKRLPPNDQQRLMQRLRQVDQMPPAQRQRWLARNELLEHMSPEERMQINRSAQQWSALPQARQGVMKNAFRDLRGVPPDQRQTVLNSDRYQRMFSPQERNILGNMLKAEPYEPQR